MSKVDVSLHRVTKATAKTNSSGSSSKWLTLTFSCEGEETLEVTLFSEKPDNLLGQLTAWADAQEEA